MTDDDRQAGHRVSRRQFLGLVGSGVVMAGAGVSAGQSSLPVSVETAYLGQSTDDVHAVRATVRVEPTTEFGTISKGQLTLRASDGAFIGNTVETSQQTGGDQVLTRARDDPLTFTIGRVEPGETVSLAVRLYPKATFPDEKLGAIAVSLQRGRNNEVVDSKLSIAHPVTPDEVSYGESPTVPPWAAGAGGIGIGALLAGAVTSRLQRVRERRVADILARIADRATSTSVANDAEEALSLLDTAPDDTDSNSERSRGSSSEGERSPSDGESGKSGGTGPLVDFDD